MIPFDLTVSRWIRIALSGAWAGHVQSGKMWPSGTVVVHLNGLVFQQQHPFDLFSDIFNLGFACSWMTINIESGNCKYLIIPRELLFSSRAIQTSPRGGNELVNKQNKAAVHLRDRAESKYIFLTFCKTPVQTEEAQSCRYQRVYRRQLHWPRFLIMFFFESDFVQVAFCVAMWVSLVTPRDNQTRSKLSRCCASDCNTRRGCSFLDFGNWLRIEDWLSMNIIKVSEQLLFEIVAYCTK